MAALCTTCASPTASYGDRCADCFHVESRLADYLKRGGDKARRFVMLTASEAILRSREAARAPKTPEPEGERPCK